MCSHCFCDLGANQLSSVPAGLFDKLINLEYLNLFDNPLKCLGGPVPAKWANNDFFRNLPICGGSPSPGSEPAETDAGKPQGNQGRINPVLIIGPIVAAVALAAGFVWYVKSRRPPAMNQPILSSP